MLFLLCLIAASPTGVELAIRQFETDYPNVTVCESKMMDQYHYQMPYSYMYLKGHFGGLHNCTHIEGNLVLRNIWPDPEEPDLGFLEHVVEVSGMLVMRNNSLGSVILPRLRVIRGEHSARVAWRNRTWHRASLVLDLAAGARAAHVVLPSLRAIMRHSVHFRAASPQPHLPGSVLWQELFEKPALQSLLTRSSLTERARCHPACSDDSTTNLGNHCWSANEQHCQKRSKCVARRKDGCNWCYFKRIGNATLEDCCNEGCSGGCHGKSNSDCVLCRRYVDKASCVVSCPQELVFSEGRWRQNPNFKLRVGMMCASACPANLLQQEDSCIYKCNSSRFFRQNDKCIPCSNSSECALAECRTDTFHKSETDSFFMTKEVLANFTNCEHVHGELVFNANSFDKSRGNITVEMLYRHLARVKYITGSLMIADSGPDLRNLTFLDQLVRIQYQPVRSNTAALNLVSTQLQFLGLRRLRRVGGDVHSLNNSALCFLASLPWRTHILDSSQFGASFAPCPSWLEAPQFRPGFDELMSTLSDYTRHPTFYLHILNDPCLTFHALRKRRLESQCSYELHQFPRHKGIYQQHSLDGTISTFIGDYSDDLIDKCITRQNSNLSWDNKYNCTDNAHDLRRNLLHCPSTLSEDVEEQDPIGGSGDPDTGYLEPVRK